MARILVIDDEPAIADAIDYALTTEGLTVVRCATLQAARAALAGIDLVVLVLRSISSMPAHKALLRLYDEET